MNAFVDFINQFYSQNPSQNAGYDELSVRKLDEIPLKITKLVDDVARGTVNIVIFTGNAGDGKTHLCSQLFKSLTGEDLPNKKIYRAKTKIGKKLHIVKDASEVPLEELEPFIREMEQQLSPNNTKNNDIYILAGNEGKLSGIFSKNKFPMLQQLLDNALSSTYDDRKKETDATRLQSNARMINFNWRSLAEKNAFFSILNAFSNSKNWEPVCEKCTHCADCPIYFNAQSLRFEKTSESLRIFFKFFQYLNGHFTMRELFSAIAYIITGGLHCRDIAGTAQEKKQPFYLLYNNIFSRHRLDDEENIAPQDRILKELRKYDAAFAPLIDVNDLAVQCLEQLSQKNESIDNNQEIRDLRWLRALIADSKDLHIPLYYYDTMKRRLSLLTDRTQWPWPDINPTRNITDYLPFSSYCVFDDYLMNHNQEYPDVEKEENFKEILIEKLNLLANRNDKEAKFWLKIYKPFKSNQSLIMELRGDRVETLQYQLAIKHPLNVCPYLEMEPLELALKVKVDVNEGKNNLDISLSINLELFEGLLTTVDGNPASQHLGDMERVIDDFREALFYSLVKNEKRPKYALNRRKADKNKDSAVEIINDTKRIFLRKVNQ